MLSPIQYGLRDAVESEASDRSDLTKQSLMLDSQHPTATSRCSTSLGTGPRWSQHQDLEGKTLSRMQLATDMFQSKGSLQNVGSHALTLGSHREVSMVHRLEQSAVMMSSFEVRT